MSSSTSRRSTSTRRPIRSLRGAAAWLDRVGLAALFPVGDVVLPSLWQAVSGSLEVEWAVRDDDGAYVSFTPEMSRCWAWKDELPEAGLACVGRHLGRWSGLVAPRLVAPLYALTGRSGRPEDFRAADLTSLQLEVAEAVLAAGPCTGPQLRELVGAGKKRVDAAVLVLQRDFVLTNSGLVEQAQGWGAIAVDVVARRWPLDALPDAHEAGLELARTVLASSREVTAADLGGAVGWRLRRSREALEELAGRGEARVRPLDGHALFSAAGRDGSPSRSPGTRLGSPGTSVSD